MTWTSMDSLLNLRGPTAYVGAAYACTLAALALEVWRVRARQRRAAKAARQASGRP
jgi:heme exporter protein D